MNFFTIMLLSFAIGGLAIAAGIIIVKVRDIKQSKVIYYDVEASKNGIPLRKQNEKLMKKNKIPYDSTLPMFLYDSEYVFKDEKSVLKRAMCLYAVVSFAREYNAKDNYSLKEKKQLKAKRILRKFGVLSELTEKEKLFIEKPTAVLAKRLAFQQESLLVLCWSLNLIQEDLDVPFKLCDFNILDEIFAKATTSELQEKIKLRTDVELVKQNDFNFLCQWACHEENFVGKRLSKLNTEATLERFRASAWLVKEQKSWDEVDVSA